MASEIEFLLSDPVGVKDVARERALELEEKRDAQAAAGAGGFSRELGQAIDTLDQLQVQADSQARDVAMGGGNLHEVALALEKADLSMKLAMKVRQKLIETYNEVMRMSV